MQMIEEKKVIAFARSQKSKSTVSTRGKILFVLMITVIAAISVIAAGCAGKTSAKAGEAATAIFWSGEADVSWYSDEKNKFTINTAEELAGVARLVNEGNESFRGKTIRLGRDIVINDTAKWQNWAKKPPVHQWIAIGTDDNRFYGTFNGGRHTISGIYIKNTEDDQALFGVIGYKGKVVRLNVIASYVEGGNYAGILAGGNAGLIEKCYTSGIVVGDSIVGGLAGVNDGLIKNSYAAGSVKGRIHVGGLMGANRGGTVASNHSSATVMGDTVVGGFVGANWGGMIGGNFSTGKVTGSGDVGGFAGRGDGGLMRNNYYDSAEAAVPERPHLGAGKTTAEMQSAELVDSLNIVAGLSLSNLWVYSDGKYPVRSNKVADETINIDSYFATGRGGEGNPYIINTKEQLENFSMLVNLGIRFTGKYLKLGQDIMLNDTANWQNWATEPPTYIWMPIGIGINPFYGTFDGNGHTVSGIFNYPGSNYSGLFGKIFTNATIKNIGVTASYIMGYNVVGGLAGESSGTITNSYSTAIVAGKDKYVGGLVGLNNSGKIIRCYTTGATSGGEFVGGIAGLIINRGSVSECYATGAVYGIENVGGLVGVITNEGGKGCYIINSYSTGEVKGVEHVGGLAGFNWYSDIRNSYTVGTVLRDTIDNRNPGIFHMPLVGGGHSNRCLGKGTNSYFNSETAGVTDIFETETGRTTEQMMQKETFAGWDFDEIWGIHSKINNGYPHLLRTLNESEIAITEEPEPIKGDTDWYDASASEFTISTAEELAGLAAIVNGTWGGTPARDNFKGKTVKLSASIDLSQYDNWVPIGNYDVDTNNVFSGMFNGGGHVISKLTIDAPLDSTDCEWCGFGRAGYQGLFGYISGGSVENLGLDSVNITGGTGVGGIAGIITDHSRIANCYSSGEVVGTSGGVGGVAGYIGNHSSITNSFSTGVVVSCGGTGGVAGSVFRNSSVTNCYSAARVGNSSEAGYSGGIAGSVSYRSSVTNSYFIGEIDHDLYAIVGGVVGYVTDNSTVANCVILSSGIFASEMLGRIVASSDTASLSNNAAYAGMEGSDWPNKGAANRDGADLTAAAIRRDGTLGGRFTKKNGWTIENGKLPGLFGKTVEMPPHLTTGGKPAPK
jgi:hypothetical protein